MFSKLMTSDINNFCSYGLTCNLKQSPDCSSSCPLGFCTSCYDPTHPPPPTDGVCPKINQPSSNVVYEKLAMCQRRFRPVSKYFNSLGQNCSASVVQNPSSDTASCSYPLKDPKLCDECYYDGPLVVVQCSYGSSTNQTNQTSSPNTSALTGQIVKNFYYMLALGFGEVVFNALYVPPSLAHLIRLGRSAPHVVTIWQLHVASANCWHQFDQ